MNWKNTVSKINAQHYAFPEGWDTRETIAEQLECSPDRVDTLLAPGLKSGEIEKQQFPVWDARLSRKTLVWGYRMKPAQATSKKETVSLPQNIEQEVVNTVRAVAARLPGKKAGFIRDRLPKHLREALTVDMVRAAMG